MRLIVSDEQVSEVAHGMKPSDTDAPPVCNPVLARLIEEVRTEKAEGPHAYNRKYNRHNRSR